MNPKILTEKTKLKKMDNTKMAGIQIFKSRSDCSSNLIWTKCPEKGASVQYLFANSHKLLEKYPENERFNLFYTTAVCINNRELVSQNVIVFDLDSADEKHTDLYIEGFVDILKEYISGIHRSKIGIVWSGNGLHFVIEIDEPFTTKEYFKETRMQYKEIIDRLNNQLDILGIKGKYDPVVFSHARLLRVPGTKNVKKGVAKNCYLINSEFEPFPNPLKSVPHGTKEEVVEAEEQSDYIYDITAIQEECGFLKHAKKEAKNLSEPEWFAMTSLLSRVPDGRKLVHKYSEPYSDYDYDETEQKIDHALKSAPQTCAHICTLHSECSKCPHLGLVKTPLALRGYDIPKYKVQVDGKDIDIEKNSNKPKKRQEVETFRFYDVKSNSFKGVDYTKLYNFFTKERGHVVYFAPGGKHAFYRFSSQKHTWQKEEPIVFEALAQQYIGPKETKPCTTANANEFIEYIKRENAESDENFFNPPGLIPFSNGVLHLINNEVKFYSYDEIYEDRNPKETYAFTYKHNFPYDPNCSGPRFNEFLDEVSMGNREIIDVLQEYTGSALFKIPNKQTQKAMILIGTGANGKSVFTSLVRHILHPEATASYKVKEIGNDKKMVHLLNKSAAITDEMGTKSILEGESFKELVGGGSMEYEPKYSHPMEAIFDAKFFICGNALPFTNDVSKGLLRRLLIVPFDAHFPENKQDKNLLDKLYAEAPAVINWAIEGAKRLIKNNFNFTYSESKTNQDEITAFSEMNNPLREWLKDNCVIDPGNTDLRVHNKELFEKFKYEELDHYTAQTQTKFTTTVLNTLRSMYPEKARSWKSTALRIDGKLGKGIYGIALKSEQEANDGGYFNTEPS